MENEAYSKVIENTRTYVQEHEEVLRRAYGADHIAFVKDVVVGHHENGSVLAREMSTKFRDADYVIGTIDEILKPRTVFLDSPEKAEKR